jgi:DNA-binding NarL/FixJ family response regulator
MSSRILIADDNPGVRAALRQLLSGQDREIVEAADGAEALSKAIDNPPDVAVLDLAMPSLDGLSVARTLSRQFPNLPLVMCTMHWTPQLQVEALKLGIHKVISKAHGGLLVSTVEEILANRQPQSISTSQFVVPPDALPSPAVMESAVPQKRDLPAAAELSSDPPPAKTPE